MNRLILFISIFVFSFVNSVHAEFYRWVDKNGKIHYSDSRPINAKESSRMEVEATTNVSNYIENDSNSTTLEEATKNKPNVEIFTTSWCGYCAKARKFLSSNNIPFTEYDIEKDPKAAQRKRQLDPTYSGIPLALINGKLLRGFNKSSYEKALN